MVDCYCGCDSKANRIKFAVSGTLFFVGMALLLISPQIELGCYKRINFGPTRVPCSAGLATEPFCGL